MPISKIKNKNLPFYANKIKNIFFGKIYRKHEIGIKKIKRIFNKSLKESFKNPSEFQKKLEYNFFNYLKFNKTDPIKKSIVKDIFETALKEIVFNNNHNSFSITPINGEYSKYPIKEKYKLAKKMRKNPTKTERKLYNTLKYVNIYFKKQFVIHGYIADVFLPEYRLIIEIDGNCHQKIKDDFRDSVLKEHLYETLRFKNKEINKNIKEVLDKIKTTIKNRINIRPLDKILERYENEKELKLQNLLPIKENLKKDIDKGLIRVYIDDNNNKIKQYKNGYKEICLI